jgi:cytidine deaminase
VFLRFLFLLCASFLVSSCSWFKSENTIQNLYYDQEIQNKIKNIEQEEREIMSKEKIKTEEKKEELSKVKPLNYKEIAFIDLDKKDQELLERALKAMQNSYSPYFKFMVGAALLTEAGEIYSATNVENAAGASICAERSAVLKAVSEGHKNFKAIAIVGKGHEFETEDIVAPCGPCRQFIYEFADLNNRDIKVIMSNSTKTKIVISSIGELLPLAFGPKDLI